LFFYQNSIRGRLCILVFSALNLRAKFAIASAGLLQQNPAKVIVEGDEMLHLLKISSKSGAQTMLL
jgi:hypothetical protein